MSKVYGLQRGFENCYQQCIQYSHAFLDEVFGKEGTTVNGSTS